MFTTWEMRWFYPGIPPATVEHWFFADCPGELLGTPDEREDVYLYTTPVCEYLGVKLRQGKLEVKWRKAELGVIQIGQNCQTKLEKWVKWVCDDPSATNMTPVSVLDNGAWISVKKNRSQRIYKINIDSDKEIQLLPIQQPIDEACALEFTKLNINGNDWWTVAFEVFGEDISLMDMLFPVSDLILKSYPEADLQAQNSFAYPRWLSLAV
jgi:hypothetical protein